MQRQLDSVLDFEHDDVVYLAHARIPHGCCLCALSQRSRLARLDVHDDVRSWNRALDRFLHRARRGVRLFDAGGRWNADDDVGEVLARSSAHA